MKTVKRDFSKFHSDKFIRDFKSVNSSVATQNNPNIGFENLILIINNLLDQLAPFKEQAKREKKIRFKPWITQGILTSFNQRDKIHKEMIKPKDSLTKQLKFSKLKDSLTKQLKFSLYKKYRNIITTLLKKSKESHYRQYFEDSKKNLQSSLESKSAGPINIPKSILKKIKNEIYIPLLENINNSFENGIFPNLFKSVKVISVFKN